jgi:AraC-like DNA-binding protein
MGIIDEVKTYIELHFDDRNLSLDSMAEALGYSAGHISKRFKQDTGSTLVAYIQEMRMNEACRLLRSTHIPVKEIVHLVGYNDHASFSRSFKSWTGETPLDMRKKEQQQ